MFDPETLKNSSLSGLGAMLLDAMDEGVRNGEPEEVERACVEIGNEVIYRVPHAEHLRHLMDFHYKKWADLTAKGAVGLLAEVQINNSYLELRAMMAGYVQVHTPAELVIDEVED